MKQGDRDRTEVRSVARALDVLEMMRRRAPAGIRVREAAEHLGVDSATASRLLSTMIARGYASRLPNRHYMLGTRSLRLATTWIDRLIEVAGPSMARAADSCGEIVHLVQLVGSEAVTVARLVGNRRAMIDVEIGPSYPLWASAGGRALLGHRRREARLSTRGRIVVAQVQHRVGGQGQHAPDRAIERRGVAAGEITARAAVVGHEQRVADEGRAARRAGHHEGHAARRVARRVQRTGWQRADQEGLAIIEQVVELAGGDASWTLADMLYRYGFADRDRVAAGVRHWRSVLDELKPGLVIGDFAQKQAGA